MVTSIFSAVEPHKVGEMTEKTCRDRGKTPFNEAAPNEGLRPKRPLQAAGARILPAAKEGLEHNPEVLKVGTLTVRANRVVKPRISGKSSSASSSAGPRALVLVTTRIDWAVGVDPISRILTSSEGAHFRFTDNDSAKSQQSLYVLGGFEFCRIKLGESSVRHSRFDSGELEFILHTNACTSKWVLPRFLRIESTGYCNAFP